MQDIASSAVSVDPNAIGTLSWRTRSLISRGIRAGYGQHGSDLGLKHGPQSDSRGIDCGCGSGMLCDARPGMLCDATPFHGERTAGLRFGMSS